jgi:tRNA 2-thiouridine synthesizing protein C
MVEKTNTTNPTKSCITFISRSAPYGSNRANLCLDMALACAVFEQDVNYVFLDDGIYQLLKGQDGAAIQNKTLGSALETLALYSIENVYVDQQSLKERDIDAAELLPSIKLIENDALSRLIKNADLVFNL